MIQSCSVTLEPITSEFFIPVSLAFDEEKTAIQVAEDIDMEEADPPEPMYGGQFDIGDILIQILAVEVNPFPRKPGSSLEDIPIGNLQTGVGSHDDNSDHPFAKLAEFKQKLDRQ